MKSFVRVLRPVHGNYRLHPETAQAVYSAIFDDDNNDLADEERRWFLERVWSLVNERSDFPTSRLPVVSMVDGYARPLVDILLDLVDWLRRQPAATAIQAAQLMVGEIDDVDDDPDEIEQAPDIWGSEVVRRVCAAKLIIEHEADPNEWPLPVANFATVEPTVTIPVVRPVSQPWDIGIDPTVVADLVRQLGGEAKVGSSIHNKPGVVLTIRHDAFNRGHVLSIEKRKDVKAEHSGFPRFHNTTVGLPWVEGEKP